MEITVLATSVSLHTPSGIGSIQIQPAPPAFILLFLTSFSSIFVGLGCVLVTFVFCILLLKSLALSSRME